MLDGMHCAGQLWPRLSLISDCIDVLAAPQRSMTAWGPQSFSSRWEVERVVANRDNPSNVFLRKISSSWHAEVWS